MFMIANDDMYELLQEMEAQSLQYNVEETQYTAEAVR